MSMGHCGRTAKEHLPHPGAPGRLREDGAWVGRRRGDLRRGGKPCKELPAVRCGEQKVQGRGSGRRCDLAGRAGPNGEGPCMGNQGVWILFHVPLQLYNVVSYTLGNLGTALALEVSICGQDYLLPPHSILSSFRTVRSSILLEVTVTIVKMYTSQPALQIRMAVHWIGFLGNLLNMGWFREELCHLSILAAWSVDLIAGVAAVIVGYQTHWGWKVYFKHIRGEGFHGTYVCLTVELLHQPCTP